MFRPYALVTMLALLSTPTLAAPDAAVVAECDRLAASPDDAMRPKGVPGILARDMDVPAAIAACRKAVESDPGSPRLAYQLARALDQNELYDESFPLHLRAAEAGHLLAQNAVGVSYEYGEGIAKDEAAALRWYRKAADQGSTYAINNIGMMHEDGLAGLAENPAEAAVWYRKAADMGNSLAAGNLGLNYLKGIGLPQDDAEARKWLEKALAAKDDKDADGLALAGLGLLYARGGGGLPKDEAKAFAMISESAKMEEAEGQFALGELHEKGIGTKPDPVEALKWYRLAAEQDLEAAKAAVARLEKR